jgi:hypothetical protein
MKSIFIPNSYEQIIYDVLKSYNQLFLEKKISEVKNYGNLSKILLAFQYCYLSDDRANNYFSTLLNSEGGDYSRYLFFYISNLISNHEYDSAKSVSLKIEPITSTLLILQSQKLG